MIARVSWVDLVDGDNPTQTGTATFADDGSEQDALAEYLATNFPDADSAFSQEDVGRDLDNRLQNLAFRSDTIFENGTPEIDIVSGDGNPVFSDDSALLFGEVEVGSDATQFLNIVNTGVVELALTSVALNGPNASDFSTSGLSTTALSPGENTVISITFDPATPGAKTASLLIGNNDSDEGPFIVNLSGTASAAALPPVRSFIVRSGDRVFKSGKRKLNFGSVKAGESSGTTVFEIENDGTLNLRRLRLNLSGRNAGDFEIVRKPSKSLDAGDSTRFRVRFNPSRERNSTAVLSISDRDSGEELFEINLRGKGLAPDAPEIAISEGNRELESGKSTVTLGRVAVGETATVRLTIENTGTAPLSRIRASVRGKGKDALSITRNPTRSLEPGETTRIRCTYTPTRARNSKARLVVRSNDSDERVFRIKLRGRVVKAVESETAPTE